QAAPHPDSEKDHCSDGRQPGHETEYRADRPVGPVVGNDCRREKDGGECPKEQGEDRGRNCGWESVRHGTRPANRKSIVHQTNGVRIAKVMSSASTNPPGKASDWAADLAHETGDCAHRENPDDDSVNIPQSPGATG